MQATTSPATDTDVAAQYLFIVTRNRPDILARAQERFQGDPRMDVISDRRYGERRKSGVPLASDRRRGSDRRRSMKFWEDLTVYPMMVAQKYVESYEELQQKMAVANRESQELRAENKRIRDELVSLQAQARADAALKADIGAILTQFEQALGALGESLHRFGRRAHRSEKEPRLRSA